jgi:gp16 family phage-associated protein
MNAPNGNEIKHRLRQQGHTLKSWSEAHGFKYRDVSEVVRGIRRGNYGAGRDIRIALGLPVDDQQAA